MTNILIGELGDVLGGVLMKTKEFADSLEKNTDYVVMGLGSTNKELKIAYLMNPKGTTHNLRTPVRIEFRKDAINADGVKLFQDDCRRVTDEDYQIFHKLFYEYIKTPILNRMGDDGYWVVDYPVEVYRHSVITMS